MLFHYVDQDQSYYVDVISIPVLFDHHVHHPGVLKRKFIIYQNNGKRLGFLKMQKKKTTENQKLCHYSRFSHGAAHIYFYTQIFYISTWSPDLTIKTIIFQQQIGVYVVLLYIIGSRNYCI